MLFILGIIVGMILALIAIVVALRFQTEIKRKVEQSSSQLKTKGKILDPDNEEIESWVNNLPSE